MRIRISSFLASKLPALPIPLLMACNGAWADSNRDYIQGGVDVVAASDESKPVLGWEFSFWRLENLPTEIFGPLTGHGYTIGFENRETAILIYAQYNRISYAYHEKAGKLPFPIFCLIGGGSIGPILKLEENESGFPKAGINLGWWNHFGLLGGISLEYKAFLDGKPVYNISFFHRIGMPVSWWIFPIH